MKFNKFSIIQALAIVLMLGACADEPLPFETFEDLQKGAVSRLLADDGGSFFFTDPDNSAFSFTLEYFDEEDGANIASNEWFVRHRNNVTGTVSEEVMVASVSSFGANAKSGLPEATFNITMNESLAALGLTISDLNGGDDLIFDGYIVMIDGRRFGPDNTGSNLQGNNGFDGRFRFIKPLLCDSDLAGVYLATTTGTSTDGCCPDETTVETEITLTQTGDGQYTVSDWSGGLYFKWYEVYGISADTDLTQTLIDACGNITIAEFTEPFGETASATGSFDFETAVLTYQWVNGYGDQGVVILTPKG